MSTNEAKYHHFEPDFVVDKKKAGENHQINILIIKSLREGFNSRPQDIKPGIQLVFSGL